MHRINRVIKLLIRMGYDVTQDGEIIVVSLQTVNKRYSVSMFQDRLDKNYSIENTVKAINELIVGDALLR